MRWISIKSLNSAQQASDISDPDYPTTIKISSSEFVSLFRQVYMIMSKLKLKVKNVLSWLHIRREVENIL